MPTLSLHSHSVYSLRDAIVNIAKAAEKIKANGGTHYSLTDHGTIQGWLALRDACQKQKLTPVYGCELYVNDLLPGLLKILAARKEASTKETAEVTTRLIMSDVIPLMTKPQQSYFVGNLNDAGNIQETSKQLFNRVAFGYQHLVAVATSAVGRRNLIKLCNRGWTNGYYYKPQVTTADCVELSEGLLFTTACMGGPVARRMQWDPTGNEAAEYLKRWEFAKDRFYLEVQPLDLLQQRRYNAQLIALSERTGFPLVLSQDNHHLNEDEWVAHRLLMLSQNDRSVNEIEDVYEYKGEKLGFSALKRRLGDAPTWRVQEIIEQEKLTLVQKAGHHYGDIRMHWRTNDEVRRQIEVTNPELMPVVDRCLAVTDRLCEQIKDVPWPSKYRLQHHEGSRERILKLCVEELQRRGLVSDKRYADWLRKEDKVITACGFWDYIWTLYVWTKKVQDEGIPIGYARGSGGGCLVMFLLGIIRVNPVKYGLYFERFLNPARLGLDPNTLEKVKEASSCPDVDLDFSSQHRDRVVDIARELFGADRVVPVGTIGEAKVKTALADLCRVLGVPQNEYMPASKELPDDPANNLTFDEAMKIPSFAAFAEKHPFIKRYLPSLVGTMRSIGTHAGGVCIADVPLADETPLVRSGAKDGGDLVTGFGESGAERALESVGFIKFDALATITVDHVSLCAVSLYEATAMDTGADWVKPGERMLYPEQIPGYTENDPAVMKSVFYTGNTDGIFQMEESIGKDLCRIVKPDTIEEIADISTMIRPGCLQAPFVAYEANGSVINERRGNGLHFEYAARKFQPQHNPPPKLPPEILEVLRPTHYCCIYQEQMMFLIQVLTGGKMSLGEGDLYRRAIEHAGKGKEEFKRKVEELEAEMKRVSPYPAELVDRVCTIIKGGANYAFNKSHSLSYSLFSYAQAWFKHYHPHIFFASHITLLANDNKLSKAHKIVNNARSMGIEIQPPHALRSAERATWSPDGKKVYLPFTIIKGLKGATGTALREISPRCKTLEDFLVHAIAHKDIKKNHVLALARVGGLDDLGYSRLQVVAMANYVLARATTKTPEATVRAYCAEAAAWKVCGEFDKQRAQQAEVEVFGSFVNECPLDQWEEWMQQNGWTPLSQVQRGAEGQPVYFMVTSIAKKVHKSGNSKGKEWLKLTCWDGHEVCELSVWAFDLDGREDEDGNKVSIGYRGIIKENAVYCAFVQCDGDRPTTLARRIPGKRDDTLVLKSGR